MKKTLLLSLCAAALFAGGYKIPEQSLSGMALSAANVANAHGADAAYYNPANLAFNPNKNYVEFMTDYIHLYRVKFTNDNGSIYYSRKEDFIVPQFHFASKDYNGWRFGFSITYPAGLSKKWDDVIPEVGAKEFTLKTMELNPVVARKITNNLAFAVGIRFVRSNGVANELGLIKNPTGTYSAVYSQYLNGNAWNKGWNAAVSYQNDERNLKIGITYRSKINLTLHGTSSGFYETVSGAVPFNTEGSVTVPLPACLNIAVAKTFDKTTVEFDFDRTYWEKYKTLDFNFADPTVNILFGTPIPKDWKNANAYRLGITQIVNDKLTAMIGFAYDETPVPDSTIEFSLPDSDKKIVSGGFKYKITKNMSLGVSALYAYQKRRRAKIYDYITHTYTTGEFSQGGAFLMAFGMDYTF